YFWPIHNKTIAWVLTLIVAFAIWGVYLKTKPLATSRYGISFWLVVGLPLLLVFLLRLAFPDRSFDVLSYHILHSERSLQGTLLAPSDFFHSIPFNSA